MPGIRYTQYGSNAPAMELFFYLYYVITGFHGLHVSIGVVLLLTMAWRTWHGAFDQDYHTPLELSALYRDTVDIVWVSVYPVIYLVERAG